jgi:ABC-2 type transport system permease protein
VLKIKLDLNLTNILATLVFIWLGAALFSTFSLIMACLVKTRDRFMGIGQILTMPIFFASNAIYPIDIMPYWLQWISKGNPLTYEVDAIRCLMIVGGSSHYGLIFDAIILMLGTLLCVAISAKIYHRLTE